MDIQRWLEIQPSGIFKKSIFAILFPYPPGRRLCHGQNLPAYHFFSHHPRPPQRLHSNRKDPLSPTSPTPGPGGDPGETTLEGVSCPESFQTRELIRKNITIKTGGTLKLRLGSTPSLPCGWGKPELSQTGVIKQVDRSQKWPDEGVTPAPGAPGKEIWGYQPQKKGKTTFVLPCHCLNEEGSQEQLEGNLEVKIHVQP